MLITAFRNTRPNAIHHQVDLDAPREYAVRVTLCGMELRPHRRWVQAWQEDRKCCQLCMERRRALECGHSRRAVEAAKRTLRRLEPQALR